MLTRDGLSPTFEQILKYPASASGRSLSAAIHPVLVYDLDKDGLSEIVMVQSASARVVERPAGTATFVKDAPLLSQPLRAHGDGTHPRRG